MVNLGNTTTTLRNIYVGLLMMTSVYAGQRWLTKVVVMSRFLSKIYRVIPINF